MVCFTIILGEGLFRIDPLKHYREENCYQLQQWGECHGGEKGKGTKHIVGLTREILQMAGSPNLTMFHLCVSSELYAPLHD